MASTLARAVLSVVVALSVGCAGADAPEVEAETASEIDQYLAAGNGVIFDNGGKFDNGTRLDNGIKLFNGLNLPNGIGSSGFLTVGTIRYAAPYLDGDVGGLKTWLDSDTKPGNRLRFLKYLVECALPSTAKVTFKRGGRVAATFTGSMDLGPSLFSGAVTLADQQKITACLLARVNHEGEVLQIVLSGPYARLSSYTTAEAIEYPILEAGFYGNLFASTPKLFICSANYQAGMLRACNSTTRDCGMIKGGYPSQVFCTSQASGFKAGDLTAACSAKTLITPEGGSWGDFNYSNCASGGVTYPHVITTRIKDLPRGAGCSPSSSRERELKGYPDVCRGTLGCIPGTAQTGTCGDPTTAGTLCYAHGSCQSGVCLFPAGSTNTSTAGKCK